MLQKKEKDDAILYQERTNHHYKQIDDNDRISWTEMFFEIAKIVAKRSKDPHTKVGAVLVKEGRVIGIGYNGDIRDFNFKFDWTTDEKYKYVIHAEMNAIANASSIGVCCNRAEIYVTLSPCIDCIKLLAQHGIKTIYFIDKYKDFNEVAHICQHAKIDLIQWRK